MSSLSFCFNQLFIHQVFLHLLILYTGSVRNVNVCVLLCLLLFGLIVRVCVMIWFVRNNCICAPIACH
jgi:hypothetical protein